VADLADIDAAIILTGGRARRLGGISKPDLVVAGRTLLATAVAACHTRGAQVIVAVGPETSPQSRPDEPPPPVAQVSGAAHLLWTREDPPYSGPARAVAAGAATLAARTLAPDARVAVLACDMPYVDTALRLLAQAMTDRSVLATTGNQTHWLLGVHPWSQLRAACSTLPADGTGESMRHLWSTLNPQLVPVPETSATDIDTWPDLP